MGLLHCGIFLISFFLSLNLAQFCGNDVEIQKKLEDLKKSREIQLEHLKMTEKEIENLVSKMSMGCVVTQMGRSHYYPRIIWAYWEDENTMQEDVKEMISVTKKSLANFTYNLVTNKNLSNFLDVSTFPSFFQKLITPHKSDYIRTCFIEKYGGVYVDASTFVTSGSEMEWFYTQVVNADAERWGFEMQANSLLLIPNFFGGAQYSPILTRYKKSLDDMLSRDLYEHCKSYNMYPEFYPYACFDRMYYLFFSENIFPSNSILVLPRKKSHYRLYDECKNSPECVKFRLQSDNAVRKYPFIKVMHTERTGVKLHFEEPIQKPV